MSAESVLVTLVPIAAGVERSAPLIQPYTFEVRRVTSV